ncbi:unnamed protein product [Macrosiphum euphorbiae]|nr:unnamed protein product [Macrosiphum euphorbiae]CAI6354833.1 unnamed protein product [Macrosiphum euphorbiae]
MLVRSSLSETVRHILSRMFVNSVLSQYSFVGQKKKLAFSSLNACSVIFDAIRNIKQFKDVPSLNIEKPLKDYLAGAKFRDLKRKNKEDNNAILI